MRKTEIIFKRLSHIGLRIIQHQKQWRRLDKMFTSRLDLICLKTATLQTSRVLRVLNSVNTEGTFFHHPLIRTVTQDLRQDEAVSECLW